MSNVFRPILPPKANYVEVLDENGEHVYKPTPQYQAQLDAESAKESRIAELETELTEKDNEIGDMCEMAIDHELRLADLELNMALNDID